MSEVVLRDRKYPKINSLYKRDQETNKLIIGNLSMPEFACIQEWDLYEKIDGTNIRVIIDNDTVEFRGRNNVDDNIPPHLLEHLTNRYTMDTLTPFLGKKAIIFGEAFGHKIQGCGGAYVNGDPIVKFHAFDVLLYNRWMQQDEIRGLLNTIDIECAPLVRYHINLSNPPFFMGLPSIFNPDLIMEGVIARPAREMLTTHGERVIWKLKHKDFK